MSYLAEQYTTEFLEKKIKTKKPKTELEVKKEIDSRQFTQQKKRTDNGQFTKKSEGGKLSI